MRECKAFSTVQCFFYLHINTLSVPADDNPAHCAAKPERGEEGLSLLKREYIINKIDLRRVQKDCFISYSGNQYSGLWEYAGKDVWSLMSIIIAG